MLEAMLASVGRILNITLGVLLIVFGLQTHTVGGTIVAVVGLIPLAAGLFGPNVFKPHFHAH